MANKALGESIVDQLEEIIYVSDLETYDLLFLNIPGQRICGTDESYRGKKCYEVLQGRSEPCPFCTNALLSEESLYTWEYDNEALRRHYFLRDKLIRWNGRLARLELAVDTTEKELVSNQLQLKLDIEERVVSYVSKLETETDVGVAMEHLLHTVLDYYDADRAYITEIDLSEHTEQNSFVLDRSVQGVYAEKKRPCPEERNRLWLRFFSTGGTLAVESAELIFERFPEYVKYLPEGLVNLFGCLLYLEKGTPVYFGLENARAHRGEMRLLSILTQFVRVRLSKRDLEQNVVRLRPFLDIFPGAFYQFEAKPPFRMLYANEATFTSLGYTRGDFEGLQYFNFLRFVHEDDRRDVFLECSKLNADNASALLSYRVYCKDGSVKWFQCGYGYRETEALPVISCISYDVTAQKYAEQRLRISEERFRIVLKQSHTTIWEYDLADRTIRIADLSESAGAPTVIADVPESQISSGEIHPDSADNVRELYRRIHEGEASAECTCKQRGDDGNFNWHKITYTNIFENGKPVRAIAMSEDVNAQAELESRYRREVHYRSSLGKDLIGSYEINFSKDFVRKWLVENGTTADYSVAVNYEELIRDGAEKTASAEDRLKMMSALDFGKLTQKYREGIYSSEVEYRRINISGKICWVLVTVSLAREPLTGDLIGFLYIRNIDERKKLELELKERAERDVMTGLYSKDTSESMIEALLGPNCKRDVRVALLMVDLDNFKYINDTMGHLYGDKVITDLAQSMRTCFDSETIIGRVGGDEFIVFLEEVPSDVWVREKAKRLCKILNFSYVADDTTLHISGSVGIAIASARDTDYRKLFEQADDAMYDTKQSGKNGYKFYSVGESRKKCKEAVSREAFSKEYMLNELEEAIMIIDEFTYEIVFMNRHAQKLIAVRQDGYCGRKCYELFYGKGEPCKRCICKVPDNHVFRSDLKYFTCFGKDLVVRYKKISWNGRPAQFCFLQERDLQSSSEEEIRKNLLVSIAALRTHENLNIAVQEVLSGVCETYCAEGAGYFEMCGGEISERHEFFKAEKSCGDEFRLAIWKSTLTFETPFVVRSVGELRSLLPEEYGVFEKLGVTSFFSVPVRDGDRTGFLYAVNSADKSRSSVFIQTLAPFVINEIAHERFVKYREYLEQHDELTGVMNRKSYVKYLMKVNPDSMSSVGVLAADVNGLKEINRSGSSKGDEILRSVAKILADGFGVERVFRFSGDEFIVLVPDVAYQSFLEQVRETQVKFEAVRPSLVSVGYLWEKTVVSLDGLVSHAEELLRARKQSYYENSEVAGKYNRPEIRETLLKSIKSGSYQIYLQPKAEIESQKIVGAEALIRYYTEKTGVVAPAKFVEFYEKLDMIHYIDLFVFESVCKLAAKWKKQGKKILPISVNFSRATMLQGDLVENMKAICSKYKVPAEVIEIEVTESLGGMTQELLAGIGKKFHAEGFKISLDDFGSKFSSLSILSDIDFDVLKLDRSLVKDLVVNRNSRMLAGAVLQICRDLGMKCVAEGVETEEQLRILKELNCDVAQGYLFNKPLPVDLFEKKYMKP